MDAPVRSSAPPAIRNTNARCAPALEKSVEVAQYSVSPTMPPRSIIWSVSNRSRRTPPSGPEAERAGRETERQREAISTIAPVRMRAGDSRCGRAASATPAPITNSGSR